MSDTDRVPQQGIEIIIDGEEQGSYDRTDFRHLSNRATGGPITRSVRPCPCECNTGGFCGGCGHAGCTGGINLR